jgi:D-tagatose-1,6-bisphosphate aldolase subunit GatZ/KbaZ
MREALTALSQIEAELVPHWQCSHLVDVLERVMLDKPANWQHHYTDNKQVAHLLRRYSYSDRVRYYWHEPRVIEAVDVLMANLGSNSIPETMLSCFLPDEYRAVRTGTLKPNAHSLIIHRIRGVLRPYAAACGN